MNHRKNILRLRLAIVGTAAIFSFPSCLTLNLIGGCGDYFCAWRSGGSLYETHFAPIKDSSVTRLGESFTIEDRYNDSEHGTPDPIRRRFDVDTQWSLQSRSRIAYRKTREVARDFPKPKVAGKNLEAIGSGEWLILAGAGVAVRIGGGGRIPIYVGPALEPLSSGARILGAPDGTILIQSAERSHALRPAQGIADEEDLVAYDLALEYREATGAKPITQTIALKSGDHYLQMKRSWYDPDSGSDRKGLWLYRIAAPAGEPAPRVYLLSAQKNHFGSIQKLQPGIALKRATIVLTPLAMVADIVATPLFFFYVGYLGGG
ncbi:MAG: hypothetical protein NXI24_10615 [bacterium]|nr:hypothetical protein [bacterium]